MANLRDSRSRLAKARHCKQQRAIGVNAHWLHTGAVAVGLEPDQDSVATSTRQAPTASATPTAPSPSIPPHQGPFT